jgi:hypothetical protein
MFKTSIEAKVADQLEFCSMLKSCLKPELWLAVAAPNAREKWRGNAEKPGAEQDEIFLFDCWRARSVRLSVVAQWRLHMLAVGF